jgi:hypothetical protein
MSQPIRPQDTGKVVKEILLDEEDCKAEITINYTDGTSLTIYAGSHKGEGVIGYIE